ncbi:crossover junction endodeoxyribonuclease RuvC [Cytobacillus pseudoceanisediminis]|uniref:crossover junction endodeoxyribonuclease RuvC n=1 Tax=Cytobacillus pseudoceanisediminis TaxID=3051614 RepID=UPI003CEBA2B3
MVYVLGLDVSMNSTGWAVLSIDSEGVVHYVDSGIIKANTKLNHGRRLRKQREAFQKIVKKYPISFVAREAGFSRHVKSTQTLFKAYGVTEEFFAENDLVEYAASTIKKIVGGSGRASKEQVEAGIRKKLKLPTAHVFASDDESDSIGVALTLIQDKKLSKGES